MNAAEDALMQNKCNQKSGSGVQCLLSFESLDHSDSIGVRLSSANLAARYTAHCNARYTHGSRVSLDLPRKALIHSIKAPQAPKVHRKKVGFTEFSSLHLYIPVYPDTDKAYKLDDYGRFRVDATSEAVRIRARILRAPGLSTKDTVKRLLDCSGLALEEMLGLEHVIFGVPYYQAPALRRDHMEAVLMKQQELRGHPAAGRKLGEFSAARSHKSAKHARIRGALVAELR